MPPTHTTYRVCQNSLQSSSDNGTFVGFYSVSGLATATTTTPSTVQLCNRMQITLPIVLLIFTSTRYNRSSIRRLSSRTQFDNRPSHMNIN